MKRHLYLFISVGLIIFQSTLAGTDEEKIATEIAMKSAESYAKSQIADYVNKTVVTNLPTGLGSTVFSSIDLASAAYDFSRADTDKQRAYSGSRAGIAAYALLGGPAAPALGAALLVAAVLESGMQASHMAEMLEIYKAIQENYNRILEIQSLVANAAWLDLRYYINTAYGSLAGFQGSLNFFDSNCSTADKVSNLEMLDACISSLGKALLSMQLFIDSVNGIDTWMSSNSQLSKHTKDIEGFDLTLLHFKRSEAEKSISEANENFRIALSLYTSGVADMLYKQAQLNAPFSTKDWLRKTCTASAIQHARNGAKLILDRNALRKNISTLQGLAYKRGAEFFKNSICTSPAIAEPNTEYFSRITLLITFIKNNTEVIDSWTASKNE